MLERKRETLYPSCGLDDSPPTTRYSKHHRAIIMKTSVLISLFFLLVAILFYSLFKGDDKSETENIRENMMIERLEKRQDRFLITKKKRCIKNIYEEAEAYVDSLIQAIGIEGRNGVDTVFRPYRPSIASLDSLTLKAVPLKPLFESIDSIKTH